MAPSGVKDRGNARISRRDLPTLSKGRDATPVSSASICVHLRLKFLATLHAFPASRSGDIPLRQDNANIYRMQFSKVSHREEGRTPEGHRARIYCASREAQSLLFSVALRGSPFFLCVKNLAHLPPSLSLRRRPKAVPATPCLPPALLSDRPASSYNNS